jgi:hypothetical protein
MNTASPMTMMGNMMPQMMMPGMMNPMMACGGMMMLCMPAPKAA